MADNPRRRSGWTIGVAAVFGSVAVALGLARLSDTPLWRDEALSAAMVDQPLGDLARALGLEGGMGPWYVALWFWACLDDGDAWLRGLPIVGGAVAMAATTVLAQRLFDRRTAVIAGTLLVLNPFFLRHLTELRVYSWAVATAVASTLAFVRLRRDPTTANAVVYGVATGVLVALSFPGVLVTVAQLVGVPEVFVARRTRRLLVVAVGVAAVVLAPWLVAPARRLGPQHSGWAPTDLEQVRWTMRHLVGGTSIGLVMAAGMVMLAVALLARDDRLRDRSGARLVLSVAVLPPVALVAISLVQPTLSARYLSTSLPFMAITAGAGYALVLRRLRSPVAFGACLVGMVVVLVWWGPGPVLTDPDKGEDLRAAAAALARDVQPGDVVLFWPTWARVGVAHYADGSWVDQIAQPDTDSPHPYESTFTSVDVAARLDGACRVWVVGYPQYHGFRPFPDPVDALAAELDRLTVESTDRYGELFIELRTRLDCTPS
jgi:hypothetical protein